MTDQNGRQPITITDEDSREIFGSIVALRKRTEKAEAEAAAYRDALEWVIAAEGWRLWDYNPDLPAVLQEGEHVGEPARIRGDAGAVFQREHALLRGVEGAARRVFSEGRDTPLMIALWLSMHRGEIDSFVILDDDADMGKLADRLVHTDWRVGIQEEHVIRALELFGVVAAAELPTGVRPEVIETGLQIIDEDRELLDRLAAYDAEPEVQP